MNLDDRAGGSALVGGAANRHFQAGGTLVDDAFYVERRADRELLHALLDHQFCYVFAPRQIGKSSLRTRVAMPLKQAERRSTLVRTAMNWRPPPLNLNEYPL